MNQENLKSKVKNKKTKKITLKKINIAIILLIAGFLFGHLACINNLSIKGFELRELRKVVDETREENKKLELAAMELESYQKIEEKISKAGMIKNQEINYISADDIDGAVAKR